MCLFSMSQSLFSYPNSFLIYEQFGTIALGLAHPNIGESFISFHDNRYVDNLYIKLMLHTMTLL